MEPQEETIDSPPSEHWTQQDNNTTNYPSPPILSFRAFHTAHFSWPQRQAFFGGRGEPHISPYWPYYIPSVAPSTPLKTNITAEPSTTVWEPFYNTLHSQPIQPSNDISTVNQHSEGDQRVSIDDTNEEIEPGFTLTREAIEIFEFSRRFREEKAAALAQERVRMARRRSKRRRLTRLGFAFDEGNSGSDEELPQDHEIKNKDDANDHNSSGDDSKDATDIDEDEDEDGFVPLTEPSATDTEFLTQPSRQRDMTRQRLYGPINSNRNLDKKEKDTSSIITSATNDEMWSIKMLEAILNQTYIDSLNAESSINTKQGGKSMAKSRSSGQSEVVYWPGMPMRC
ncbi:hypothetical protein FBU30_006567 [Linnemannia zychae]|nr:hypothetical protein FBU30_006567 [Linnemannia zychae]